MPWNPGKECGERRELLRAWLRRKLTVAALCRRQGISRKTAYKWIGRFKRRGESGLRDRSRRNGRVHNRPAAKWLERIRRWKRRYPSWGAPKLRWILVRQHGRRAVPSEAAISRWLRQWGLSRKPSRSGKGALRIVRPQLTLAHAPNEVWTADFKGWFRTADGQRVEPLTVRDLASRYILAVVLLPHTGWTSTRAAFVRIFRTYGLPRVIRTDNGTPFGAHGALGLTRLSAWWVKLGIRVEFIAPGRPDQNGAHEQLHAVYKNETLHPPAASLAAQQRRSERWRRIYNHERPHEGLGMRLPAEVYRKSARSLPCTLKAWAYPPTWITRLVKGKGMISLHGRGRFVGEAFEQERVGLEWNGRDRWRVHFGPLLIGELFAREQGGIHASRYHRTTTARPRRFRLRTQAY